MKPHRGGSGRGTVATKSHSPYGGFKHQAAPQQHKHHVSLQRFAQGKVNTSHKKAEEAEVARHKKAAALRKYAKLCKREGIVSDRVNMSTVPTAKKADHDQDQDQDKKQKQQKQQQKRDGHHSFSSAQQEAQAAKESKVLRELERQQVHKEIKESEKARKQKRRETLIKTKKGQPVLNNLVTKLLTKIQGSKAAAETK